MSVLVGNNTRLIIQGITGTEGSFHGQQMIDYGTNIVAGVTPGKGGQEALPTNCFLLDDKNNSKEECPSPS